MDPLLTLRHRSTHTHTHWAGEVTRWCGMIALRYRVLWCWMETRWQTRF